MSQTKRVIEEDLTEIERKAQIFDQDPFDYHFDKNPRIVRNPAPELDKDNDDVTFQWLDVDMYDNKRNDTDEFQKENPNIFQHENNPSIRFYGVTREGHSVCLKVHGFLPYFYCSVPSGWKDEYLDEFRDSLEKRLLADGKVKEAIHSVEVVSKYSIMGYQGEEKNSFLKITVTMPTLVPTAKSILANGFIFMDIKSTYEIFEAKIPFVLRAMVDMSIVGCNWLTVPKGKYLYRREENKQTLCQYELEVYYKDIISHPTVDEYMDISPFRILSFDIECIAPDGGFPDATKESDQIITIACALTEQGSTQPCHTCVFCLNTCAPIPGTDVFWYKTEADLLRGWAAYIKACDPDLITGYNIQNFDLPYIFDRATLLKTEDVHILGRVKNQRSKKSTSTFSSSAYGTHENIDIEIYGRVVFDLLQFMRREYKLTSYSLNNVSNYFLGDQKEDVKYNQICELQNGDEITRNRLAQYCLKDSLLPQRLLDKLIVLINHIEMARVAGVPISMLLSRGQQIKVISMLYRKACTMDFIVPSYESSKSGTDDAYQGATVIEPKKGFYKVPIATLDFSSLYPSIMISHNICYSTLIFPAYYKKTGTPSDRNRKFTLDEEEHKQNPNLIYLPPESYEMSPNGDLFLRKEKREGILPIILKELLSARKKAKKDMANEKDPLRKKVQNGRQLALKISANSVYGFTGATVGQLPCLSISKSVTAYGRQMIDLTKNTVMEKYCKKNGYPDDSVVVYGDTDSVMVRFGVQTVEEAMKLGKEAADYITTLFPPPVKLEFEKVYYPYLLMNKKRYAGLFWTNPVKWDKMDCKGIETVRRDNCGLVRLLVDMCLKKILIDMDAEGAIQYVKDTIASLLQNNIDISLLVITKSLGKKAENNEYKTRAAHVELAERMFKRDPGSAPKVGDRVQYVIIEKEKNAPAYLKSEDPIYVLEHNLSIDVNWYLEHQLQGPLERIFEPVIKDTKTLFSGDHTLVKKATTIQSVGLGKFVTTSQRCMGCKRPLDKGVICSACAKDGRRYYTQTLLRYECLQEQFTELWTTCQRCQESNHQKVICGNRDCPIFFQREKVQRELNDTQGKLQKFDELF